jgi:phosphoglycolate phosphatase-like HAD superfamily hydrolase
MSHALQRSRCLAVFDIDGTLTLTSAIDDACYIRAVREEWGIEDMSTDWSTYEHSTDNAIAAEIFRRHRGRDATTSELEALRDRFARYVQDEARRDPGRFRQVPGADAALRGLPDLGWSVAIATGGWTPSARCKLETAGVGYGNVPAAFACDARPREAIIQIAAHRAAERAGIAAFERVVYLGDGAWDARACRRLGMPFVGVGGGERAERLWAEGAGVVLNDFLDLEALVAALDTAAIPHSGGALA